MSFEPDRPAAELERLAALRQGKPLRFYRRCLPEVATAWIAFAPRSWPGADGLWTDLAARRLGSSGRGPVDWRAADSPLEDVVYLPPVGEGDKPRRDRLARLQRSRGTPVLEQLRPGEGPLGSGVTSVYDLLEPLLARSVAELEGLLPPDSDVVWPLGPGLSDDREFVGEVVAALVASGVRGVHFAVLDLGPAERRRLAEGLGEGGFERVFHGHSLPQRELARAAHAAGLEVFLGRPLPEPPLTGRENRAIAADLYLAAELWTQLDRNPEAGQALFRAAREADRSRHDLASLAREGNLSVLAWLDDTGRELVSERVAGARSRLVAELVSSYRQADDS